MYLYDSIYRISVQSNLIKGVGVRLETRYFTFYDVGGIQSARKKYKEKESGAAFLRRL